MVHPAEVFVQRDWRGGSLDSLDRLQGSSGTEPEKVAVDVTG